VIVDAGEHEALVGRRDAGEPGEKSVAAGVPGHLDDMAPLHAYGVINFKAFMSETGVPDFRPADDDTLLEGMRRVARALTFAADTGCRLHVVHVSTAEGVALIRQARRAAWTPPGRRPRTSSR
jgi:hypothetical protein